MAQRIWVCLNHQSDRTLYNRPFQVSKDSIRAFGFSFTAGRECLILFGEDELFRKHAVDS